MITNYASVEPAVRPETARAVAPSSASLDVMVPPSPTRRWLVFTSAGSNARVDRWLSASRSFDLWVVYYADGALPDFCARADFVARRKGAKYQNLAAVVDQYRSLVERYEAVLVMDDDIMIDAAQIDRLFKVRQQENFWIVHAAFSRWGKVSHPITAVKPGSRYRLTNFVENTAPMFRTDKLLEFMAVYDRRLLGWGVDWQFLWALGPDLEGKVAVVDEIVCLNPHDIAKKDGKREIDRLLPTPARQLLWEQVRRELGITIDETHHVEYAEMPQPPIRRFLSRVIGCIDLYTLKVLRKLGLHVR